MLSHLPSSGACAGLLPHSTWFCKTVNVTVGPQGTDVTQVDQQEWLSALNSVNGEGMSEWPRQGTESHSLSTR